MSPYFKTFVVIWITALMPYYLFQTLKPPFSSSKNDAPTKKEKMHNACNHKFKKKREMCISSEKSIEHTTLSVSEHLEGWRCSVRQQNDCIGAPDTAKKMSDIKNLAELWCFCRAKCTGTFCYIQQAWRVTLPTTPHWLYLGTRVQIQLFPKQKGVALTCLFQS